MAGFTRNKVVVPVDFSDKSFAAVDIALEHTDSADQVYLVHVLEELSPVHPGELYGTIDEETRAAHSTEAMKKRFEGAKYDGLNYEIVHGAPGAEIAEFAEKIEADLIVMPSHGRTGIARMLIGSVTERTIRFANCPVLVLRGD